MPPRPKAVMASVLANTRGNCIAVHARTKLSRRNAAGRAIGLRVISASVLNAFVITSYSIHYTKLYEHTFPELPGPVQSELQLAEQVLLDNYGWFLQYLTAPTTDPAVAHRLKRLLFRMLGIYDRITSYNVWYTKLLRDFVG